MRIAHVNPSFWPAAYYGGPTTTGIALCRSLAALGHDVRVLTTDTNGPGARVAVATAHEQPLQGFRVRYARRWLPESVAPGLLGALPELVRWASVVHLTAVYNFTTFPTLALARRLGRPVVWTPRGAHLRWAETRRSLPKAAWDHLARAVAGAQLTFHATSEREADAIRAIHPAAHVAVVPNGVAIPDAPALRAPSSTLRLLFVGRLDPIKNLEALLDALARLRLPEDRPWTLRIAGDGAPGYVESLKARAPAPLRERVQWEGRREGPASARFDDTDLLVLPSHSENFGMVVAEALAAGVPVIASRGTPWERLEAEGAGRWVAADPATLADAIAALATEDLAAMGGRGRAWMAREFTWPAVAARFAGALAHAS